MLSFSKIPRKFIFHEKQSLKRFPEKDFEKVSLRKIAALADVTIGTIYSRYKTLFCEPDNVMISLRHGVLHRKHTLAEGEEYCDYYITGNRE